MSNKQVYFGREALVKMVIGLDKAADVVGGTIGPRGRNVYLDDAMTPKITNDGATIADKIVLEDKLENAGAYVIRNVASQQNDDCGDGTTTVSVLTQAIVRECLLRPENAMEIKQSLNEAGQRILKLLAKQSKPITVDEVEKVALISSEDKHIASLIAQIIKKLGKDAIVNVEDSKTFATDFEIVDGYEANIGFMHHQFITNKRTGKAVFTDVPVLVSQKKISNLAEIAPIFEMFKKEGIGQCVFVVDDIDDGMLGILIQNKMMGLFNSLVIKASAELLQDIEATTGAIMVGINNGVTFTNFEKKHLGKATKVVCDANKTLFVTSGNSAIKAAARLEVQAEAEPNQYTAKKLRERANKLKGGVAVLRVGASTDFERDYLRLKAEDSVKAVQAALAEGVVEGGGMALWRIAEGLNPKTIGEEILKKALIAPLKRIIENAGKDYVDIMVLMTKSPTGSGYDAKSGWMTNLISVGIIDPTKVERCALENAISAAGTFITTDAIITDVPDKDERK